MHVSPRSKTQASNLRLVSEISIKRGTDQVTAIVLVLAPKARPPVTASHSHSMVPGGFEVMS